MKEREQKRLLVLNRVIGGQTTAKEAAELLDLSIRQVRRILAAYRKEGAAALAHGNRGRKPANATDPAVAEVEEEGVEPQREADCRRVGTVRRLPAVDPVGPARAPSPASASAPARTNSSDRIDRLSRNQRGQRVSMLSFDELQLPLLVTYPVTHRPSWKPRCRSISAAQGDKEQDQRALRRGRMSLTIRSVLAQLRLPGTVGRSW